MKLSIIITNYKSKDHLLLCLTSINRFVYKKFSGDFEVVLVNNEKEKLSLPVRYPFVNSKIINAGKNVGFGTANNLGVIMAKGEYLLFLNPDTVFVDSTLQKAIDFLDSHQEVGVLGLKIIDYSRKSPQNWTCGKRSTWGSILFKNTINKPWNKNTAQEVKWVSGTALIIRRPLFKKIKGFDKNFFMYFEDQDLCLKVGKLNKKVIFYPYAKIIHFNGKSWKNKKKQKLAYQTSQLYFFKKYNSFFGYCLLKIIYKIKYLASKLLDAFTKKFTLK